MRQSRRNARYRKSAIALRVIVIRWPAARRVNGPLALVDSTAPERRIVFGSVAARSLQGHDVTERHPGFGDISRPICCRHRPSGDFACLEVICRSLVQVLRNERNCGIGRSDNLTRIATATSSPATGHVTAGSVGELAKRNADHEVERQFCVGRSSAGNRPTDGGGHSNLRIVIAVLRCRAETCERLLGHVAGLTGRSRVLPR